MCIQIIDSITANDPLIALSVSQEQLGDDFQKVLYENIWDQYVTDDSNDFIIFDKD